MPISLGAHVGQQNMSAADMRALWRKLDQRGFDWISAWDHFYEAPPAGGAIDHFEALTTLGALAVETERARLGCLVFYVGYRNPALLAKAATTLDHLSGGRFELGIGAGWHQWEATAYGYDFPPVATRLAMLDEAASIIRGMLNEPRTTFAGRHFRVSDASCLPRPVHGSLPLWIGGVGEKRTLRLVAKHADGWNAAYVSPQQYAHLSSVLDGHCEALGREPTSVRRAVNVAFNLAVDQPGAQREATQLKQQWGAAAERIADGALLGTPTDAIERILQYAQAGATDINIALRAPFNAEALDAYIEEVMPRVRRELDQAS
jgi:F420-dependent oxidoreductase-like protein